MISAGEIETIEEFEILTTIIDYHEGPLLVFYATEVFNEPELKKFLYKNRKKVRATVIIFPISPHDDNEIQKNIAASNVTQRIYSKMAFSYIHFLTLT